MSYYHTWHVISAIKEVHRELSELRKEIEQLRDTVSTMGDSTQLQFVLNANAADDVEESESDSDDDLSVQSAPATVSYERGET